MTTDHTRQCMAIRAAIIRNALIAILLVLFVILGWFLQTRYSRRVSNGPTNSLTPDHAPVDRSPQGAPKFYVIQA